MLDLEQCWQAQTRQDQRVSKHVYNQAELLKEVMLTSGTALVGLDQPVCAEVM